MEKVRVNFAIEALTAYSLLEQVVTAAAVSMSFCE